MRLAAHEPGKLNFYYFQDNGQRIGNEGKNKEIEPEETTRLLFMLS